jgi:prepilin-type N-terminal cleavage/methylation domain-containing protein
MKKILRQKKGFTLIEVLISLVVFAVGLLGFASLEIVAMRNMAFSKDLAKANTYAQQTVEQLKSTDWANIAVGTARTTVLEDKFSRSYSVVQEGDSIKKVSITVTWTSATYGTKTVTIYTDLYANPPVG